MRVLLDTHAFLWWITDDARLSARAREIVADGDNEMVLSVASALEIAIKARLGRLTLPPDVARFVTEQIDLNAFHVLPVQPAHALHVNVLPDHHRDPFDRLLAAQGLTEGMPILSRDPALAAYGVDMVW